MNIIYTVCKDCGNRSYFKIYANGIVQCDVCKSLNIAHNVIEKTDECSICGLGYDKPQNNWS